MIFVHRLRKDYSMNHFNSKRFRKKNENARGVFWIMVSRSLVISLHFNEHLSISGFLFYFWKFIKINENRLYERAWTFFSKVIQKLLIFGAGFGSFLNVSKHFNKSTNFLIIRDRYNPFKPVTGGTSRPSFQIPSPSRPTLSRPSQRRKVAKSSENVAEGEIVTPVTAYVSNFLSVTGYTVTPYRKEARKLWSGGGVM